MHKPNKFGRESRLTTPASFRKVFSQAKKFRYDGITLLTCENDLPNSRIGICIPKKQVPRAVDRNRMRRIVREFFRAEQHNLTVNLDIVFLVYSSTLNASNVEIFACLKLVWSKLIGFFEKD